ncbi:MFS transporter [Kitasatospora sp. NPDC096077]|uniref:MFS transporter n=1 Tax=Kitasatospora sp. NPDC096077 TaxID=3155544 RepID=UPI00332E0D83
MREWYRSTSPAGRRAFWTTFGGWALEGADAQIYGLVLPTLTSLWHLTGGQGGLASSATLISTALGGWLAGAASDRWDRVAVLRFTIAWYAVATALVGFADDFPSLLTLRCLQGLGFGGEWAAGTVLISEYVTSRHRGRVLGAVQSGWAVGWAFTLAAYSVLVAVLPEAWAWRAMFWLGVLPALLVLALRRGIPDPTAEQRRREPASPTAIFRPGLLRVTVLGALLGLGSHGGYYALTTFLPTYLHTTRHLSVMSSGGHLTVFIAGSFLGYLASGRLSDRIGRRRNVLVFAVGCLVTLLPYLLLPLGDLGTLVAGAPLGFFSAGIPGGLGALFAELYPTRVRGSGQGFCYNLGRVVSAAFPALVGQLSGRLGLAASIALFAGFAYALAAVAAACLPPEGRNPEPSLTPAPVVTSG